MWSPTSTKPAELINWMPHCKRKQSPKTEIAAEEEAKFANLRNHKAAIDKEGRPNRNRHKD